MSLKVFTIDFKELSRDFYLRNDEKYHNFLVSSDWNLFNSKNKSLISLKNILSDDYVLFDYKENKEYKGIPTGQSYLDKDGKIKDYQIVPKEEHPGRLKYRVSNDNILISSLRLAKAPTLFFENEDLKEYVFSNGFYIFKVNDSWNKKFILYILRSNKLKTILDDNIYRGIVISSYKKEDLLKIKIPLSSKEKQDEIVSEIELIENEIKKLKSEIKELQEIINKVFAEEFNFDLEKFEELKKEKHYYLDFFEFANNKDVRQSVKFHRKACRFVLQELEKITNKKVKDFITEPIVLGASVSPKYYDDNGDYNYISVATIKNYKFESENSKLVSKEYSDKNLNKTVAKNDILMARSGTVGKVALIEDEDLKGIFADFTMRIRLQNYNPLFAYYYFRSEFFQYLIEVNKKGLGNTNIFPVQIKEFPLIDISLSKQKEITQKIKTQRNKIDEIIEGVMK